MKTWLDWSAYRDAGMGDAYADIPKQGGDFAKAVAVCINSRQCETEGRGVMCPSYRVSRDPELATGGRVRRLKSALNRSDEAAAMQALADPELERAMDLCISCKGCKRECENSVDMATIKIEYQAQRRAAAGLSTRAQLFAALPRLATQRWIGPLIAWRNRTPWAARLAERWLGITAALPLPEPAPKPDPAKLASASGERGEVALLLDTFTWGFEPEIAEAAAQFLAAAGYRVFPIVASDAGERPLCCGRTYLGQGMIPEARAEARRMLAAVAPHLEAGRTVVGLEPSCLLTLRDEYLTLGLGEFSNQLAANALLLEEFLAREMKGGGLGVRLADASGMAPVLVHGHCHQKAVGAMKSMRKVLKAIPGLRFDFVEASCCGMAGSFGHEAEHAEMSRAMAEQALLPALRAEPDAAVMANGFSCRGQIRNHTDHRPRHLALVLRDLLVAQSASIGSSTP